MRLTPLDIRKQEFKKGMRGLDSDEVYAFLSTIADEYEAVLNDNKALRERLLELDDKVQEYRNMEKTLRDTLLTAERITVDAKENARRESELIIKQAEFDADKGVRDIKADAMRLRQEIKSLKSQRESYMGRMKMLVESHFKFLESAERDFEEEERTLDVGEKKSSRQSARSRRSSVSRVDDRTSKKSARLPAEGDISETSMSPPLDTPISPSTLDRPLPEGPPTKPSEGLRTDAETASGTTVTMTEPSASDRLNALLDRVVQRTTQLEDKAAAAETERQEAQPAREVASDLDLSPTPITSEDTDAKSGEANSNERDEWSLERLKRDMLSRRSRKDETG